MLEAFLNEVSLVGIASFLGNSRDLLSLALVSTELGAKPTHKKRKLLHDDSNDSKNCVTKPSSRPLRKWSLMEEVARILIDMSATQEEKLWLPKVASTSWIGVLHQLEQRRKVAFDQLVGRGIRHHNHSNSTNGHNSHVIADGEDDGTFSCTAIVRSHVMSAGKHYASFAISAAGDCTRVGLMRPVKESDKRGLAKLCKRLKNKFDAGRASTEDEGGYISCAYDINLGNCIVHHERGFNYHYDWDGKQKAESTLERFPDTDRGTQLRTTCYVGMCLDLDSGTLTVYLNNKRLGVMKTGLSGEYCWMITFGRANSTCVVVPDIEERADWVSLLMQPGVPYARNT